MGDDSHQRYCCAGQLESGNGNAGEQQRHEISERVTTTRDNLDGSIGGLWKYLDSLRAEFDVATPPHFDLNAYNNHTTCVVTLIFACTALMYLEISVFGSMKSHSIDNSIQQVISALKMLPEPAMVRGLIWPLCVAGCMASTVEDQEFFRSLASNGIRDAGAFGNSGEALRILEKSWKFQRSEGRPVDCGKCTRRLGDCVLLV